MSRPRRRPHMSTATIITTTDMARTIMPIMAMRIIGTATIKASAPSRMCTGRTAAMITMTMTIPTTTLTRLMDAPNPEPDSLTLGSHEHESPARPGFAELPLLLWLSPAFPVGSFAYSHGLEWAVENVLVPDEARLANWIEAGLAHEFGALGAWQLRAAHDAATRHDAEALQSAIAEARAWQPTREFAL